MMLNFIMLKKKKLTALVLATVMTVSLFGCSKKENDTYLSSKGSPVQYPKDGIYPVNCEDELTYWMVMSASAFSLISNKAESPIAQGLTERTGIKVKYIHPSASSANEQFNLLLVSDDLPDIIATNWYNYGAQKALDEGYILKLNDMMKKWAPNLSETLTDMPEINKMVKTDEGDYYAFPFIRESKELCVYSGPILRADWLKKANLSIPETIDEWDTMLRKFRELGATAPLAIANNSVAFGRGFLIGAYGVTDSFFIDDNGKVAYGPTEPGYKEFVIQMKKWYDEGLLDKNFSATDVKILNSYVLNDKTGASFQLANSGLKKWLDSAADIGKEGFDLVGAPYPVLRKGDRAQFSQMDNQYTPDTSYALSTNCKNPELAMRLLDYGYSEEGYMFYNYGTEGLTYEFVNGVPTLTDFVLHNPDGKSYNDMASLYLQCAGSAPGIQSAEMVRQTRFLPQQTEAITAWSDTDIEKHLMPPFTFTQEETARLGAVTTELVTYLNEMFYGFVMGTVSMDEYDQFQERLEQLGASKAKEIYQVAVDRYNQR